jgi:hypothetical protein
MKIEVRINTLALSGPASLISVGIADVVFARLQSEIVERRGLTLLLQADEFAAHLGPTLIASRQTASKRY